MATGWYQSWGSRRLFGLLALPALACADLLAGPGFDPSLWQFKQVVSLRGSKAGGWQEACAHLQFVDGRSLLEPAHAWTCGIKVGMPLATSELGLISPELAAQTAARTTTTTSGPVFHSRPSWLGEDYCIALRRAMNELFKETLKTMGARAERC